MGWESIYDIGFDKKKTIYDIGDMARSKIFSPVLVFKKNKV